MKIRPLQLILIITLTLSFLSLSFAFLKPSYGNEKNLSLYEKIAKKEDLHYLVVGDSIGRGSGASAWRDRWFSQLEALMLKKNGVRMHGEYLVQSGATSFEGIYKLQHAPVQNNIDLAFIVFGENDRKYMDDSDFSPLYESLLRQIKARYPSAEVITITESSLRFPKFAEQIRKISSHYHASNVDMRPVFRDTGLADSELTRDGVHPNNQGYTLYADALYKQIIKNKQDAKSISELADPINTETALHVKEKQEFYARKGFREQNGYLTSIHKNDWIDFRFKGPVAGVNLLRSPDGGKMNVFVDGKWVTEISTWWPFPKERQLFISNSLDSKEHTIRFQSAGTKSWHNTGHSSVIRIKSLLYGTEGGNTAIQK
ncbi:SGNH/GDSL hydrolase family protein [Peribacillus kribbensis]|uniref:SGNH/GDSL hydrolase family protein n=1 Tax=Peribacillus kribbensis TaxID=356658 RepID=UPI00040CB3EB|nr:SGNH/GDSL hydrolase family protein [Peribacillus kribbensis]